MCLKFDYKKLLLFKSAFNAMKRIREIALATYHNGAFIRWFEYDEKLNYEGEKGLLMPVNACEVSQLYIKRYSALQYLALTTSNKKV